MVSESMTLLLRSKHNQVDYGRVSEVRRVLEVEIVRLAALRRTEHDLERLAEILSQAEISQDDRDRFADLDVAFHSGLAEATQNDLFQVLLESLADVMITVRRVGFDTPGMPTRALAHHTAILERIAAEDAAGAIAAMLAHLDESEATMAAALPSEDGDL
jgi:DNA-binding FadR family transcriptional regulator